MITLRLTITGRGYVDATRAPATLEVDDAAALGDAIALVARTTGIALAPTTLVILAGKHLGTIASHDDARLGDGDELLLVQPVSGG